VTPVVFSVVPVAPAAAAAAVVTSTGASLTATTGSRRRAPDRGPTGHRGGTNPATRLPHRRQLPGVLPGRPHPLPHRDRSGPGTRSGTGPTILQVLLDSLDEPSGRAVGGGVSAARASARRQRRVRCHNDVQVSGPTGQGQRRGHRLPWQAAVRDEGSPLRRVPALRGPPGRGQQRDYGAGHAGAGMASAARGGSGRPCSSRWVMGG